MKKYKNDNHSEQKQIQECPNEHTAMRLMWL